MHSSINLVASVRGWQVPLPYKAQTTLWVQCLIKRSSVPSPFKLHQVLTRLFQSCYSHRFALLEPACSSKHGKAATSHFITLLKLDQFLDENLWLDFNLFTKQLVPGSLLCAQGCHLRYLHDFLLSWGVVWPIVLNDILKSMVWSIMQWCTTFDF